MIYIIFGSQMVRTKRRRVRTEHLNNMRAKRGKTEVQTEVQNVVKTDPSSESEQDSTDSAFIPEKEDLIRSMFDFFDAHFAEGKKLESVGNRTRAKVEVKPAQQPAQQPVQQSAQQPVESASGDDDDVTTGTKVRLVVNGEVMNKPCYLKTRWQHSRKSRARAPQNLNETVLTGARPRGRNGGMRPVVNIPSAREKNREMNMDRVQSRRAATREKRRQKHEQSVKAERILQVALRKSSLAARVGHVYEVQQGERMVCKLSMFKFCMTLT